MDALVVILGVLVIAVLFFAAGFYIGEAVGRDDGRRIQRAREREEEGR